MIGTTDWTGLATFITALGAVLTGLIASVAALAAQRNVKSPNGVRTGEAIANIAAAVSTPPGVPPLGEVVASASDTLDHVHEVVCDTKEATGQVPVVRPGEPDS